MSRTTCGFVAAGFVAVSLPILVATTIGAGAAPAQGAPGASQDPAVDTTANQATDFSSRRGGGGRGGGFRGGGGGRGGGFRGGGGHRGGGYGGGHRGGGRSGMHTSGRRGGGHTGSRTGGRDGGMRTGGRDGGMRTGGRDGGMRTGGRDGGSRTGGRDGGARTGGARDGGARTGGTRVGGVRVGAPRVGGTRVGTTTTIRNRRFTTFTGRRFWWRGGWRTLIGVGLLTGFAIGPDFYYPEGYVALSQPACTGRTDDGCALRWQDVAADDGSTIPQCVQFCPRVRTTAAPAPAAPPPAPPAAAAPRAGCEVEVFKDKNLSGGSFKTSEDQPLLNDEWDKHIASINVISGTWDFSTEQQYNGDAMRLTPGAYRDLGPNWDGQISSFMCAQ